MKEIKISDPTQKRKENKNGTSKHNVASNSWKNY